MGFGLVDVRDLAQAHMAAAYTPEAKGRHIVSGHDTSLLEMARQLLPRYGDKYQFKKSRSQIPGMACRTNLMPGMTRKFISQTLATHGKATIRRH